MLELLSLDGYYFSVSKEIDGSFSLIANTNDVFAPAADGEVIAPEHLDTVRDIYLGSNDSEPYNAVIEWIGKQKGMVPYAWRKKP